MIPPKGITKLKKLACIILAAGEGTRLHSNIPKALHELCGEPLIVHINNTIDGLITAHTVVVIGFGGNRIEEELKRRKMTKGVKFVSQEKRLGTGHAVLVTLPYFRRYSGDILVLVGDAPLLTRETLDHLLERHWRQEAAATVLTTRMRNPSGYGRVLRHQDGSVLKIVEDKDANIYEKKVTEVNTGTYVFNSRQLFKAIQKIKPENEQGEYYLPDVIQIMVRENLRVEALITRDSSETQGINNRKQFAQAERIMRNRILDRLMNRGVTIIDPPSTFIDKNVAIGIDTIVQPNTHIRGKSSLGSQCLIGPMVQIEDSSIGDRTVINNSHILQSKVGKECKIVSSYIEGYQVPDSQHLGPFADLKSNCEECQTSSKKDAPGRSTKKATKSRSRAQGSRRLNHANR